MEPVGVFLDEEWDSLSRMFSGEEADFALLWHGHGLFPSDHHDGGLSFGAPSTFWSPDEANTNVTGFDESLFNFSDTLNTNVHCFSREGSNGDDDSNGVLFPVGYHENHHFSDSSFIPETNNTHEFMNLCVMEDKTNLLAPVFRDDAIEDVLCLKDAFSSDKLGNTASADSGKEPQLKRKFETQELPTKGEYNINGLSMENPKKKSRVSRNSQKNKKNAQPKKSQKLSLRGNEEEEEEINAGPIGPSSSCYSSEDDSNASQDLNGAATSDSKGSSALNLNGKTRASRGSATDPQSLYARKRRERINERLRILQNLVPNGTKVDISTMLEEAVHYVKFLQLQIKLLSSDDLWMYAPIAYNGMDMGLYQKILPTL
ncbi:unnamed protein product [Ilex paraguariensis]|uniref:BHLH domain-containing protein n=1 Tax=Ilex paraguariensis TaxID=185542 RepID=A0ABC8UPD7_9AQUA